MKPKTVIVADRSALDYYDCQTINVARSITALKAWSIVTGQTGPMLRFAIKLRDIVSGVFGVQPITGFSGPYREDASVGDYLDFFLIEQIEPNILVLTARDRHLDVMICVTTGENSVSIAASVVTKNFFGKLYMLPVGPAHRQIVGNALQKLRNSSASYY